MDIRKGLELMDEMDQKNRQAVEAHKTKIRGMLVNVYADIVELVETSTELQDLYKLLQCDCIDIVTASIGGKDFAVICGDEEHLKESPRIAIHCYGSLYDIVGNAMICRDTPDGQLASLSDRDIRLIRQHVREMGRPVKNRRRRVEFWHYIETDEFFIPKA